jgi:hypothetical protein
MKKIIIIISITLTCNFAFAWDGFDYETGNYIEIESGQLVRPGRDIEIYDYGHAGYRTVEVQSVSDDEVEVYDYSTGEYRAFDMD